MPDKKLTDNEIIKALECCKNDGVICMKCPYKKANGCMEKLSADALDLINRQKAENKSQSIMIKMLKDSIEDYKNSYINQKAEIERLQNILLSFTSKVITWGNKKGYDTTELSLITILDEVKNAKAEIKAEAYKEFAERLKEEYAQGINWFGVKEHYFVNVEDIDNLVKEMVGEDNASKNWQ